MTLVDALLSARAELEKMRAAGIDKAIDIVRHRRKHYELYTDPAGMMRTHPATFAVIDELLVFLEAERERALSTPPQDERGE